MTSLKSPPRCLKTIPEAFVFDVFGTVFDWRGTVSTYLERTISQKLTLLTTTTTTNNNNTTDNNNNNNVIIESKADLSTPESLKSFCATLSQEWRDSYKQFVSSEGTRTDSNIPLPTGTHMTLATDKDKDKEEEQREYETVDTRHYRSLTALLQKYTLSHLFSPSEIHEVSKIWHFLNPWEDSIPGIDQLRELGIVSTLSNGNVRLLVDLGKSSGVRFDMVLSGQLWGGYKPHPRVYIGACEVLGVGDKGAWEVYKDINHSEGENEEEEWRRKERGKVAMVAAHIGDLRAAKRCGLTTIYIERPGEDDDREAGENYLREGEDWIDIWVTHAEGGILEVARRLKELKEDLLKSD
ncbi:hypothetical protein AA313_de0200237 [Arthrobotrys entomopaga]|nr:hypothetical protein AA313_de0200237 [Arthrobotrys entomopaga]